MSRHERVGQLRIWCVPDDNQQGDAMLHDRRQFIRFIADAAVMCDRDPAALTNALEPVLVRIVVREMIGMALHGQASGAQDLGKSLAKIPIREENRRHAARS